MKILKLLGMLFAGLMLLFILIAGGMIFYLQNADHRSLVQDMVKKNSGYRAQFESLEMSFFPRFEFRAEGMRILPHQGDINVFEAKSINVSAPLLPLVLNQKVSKIEVDSPVVRLVRDTEGKANWEAVRRSRRAKKGGSFDPGMLMKLQNVSVQNGHLEMRDAKAQQNVLLQNIKVSLANETNVVKRGTFNALLNGMPVDMLARLRLEGGNASAIPTDIRFTLEDNQISFEGTLIDALASTPGLAGTLDMRAPSLLALVDRLKLAAISPDMKNEMIGLKANINANAKATTLNDAEILFGKNTVKGDLSFQQSRKGIGAEIDLSASSLDFNHYAFCQKQPQAKKKKAQGVPWSDQMIDLSALHPHSISTAVNFANVQCMGRTFSSIKVNARSADKQLTLNELRIDLAPESYIRQTGSLSIEQPLFGRFETEISNIDPSWFMPNLEGKFSVPFSGIANVSYNGSSVADWMSSMKGNLELKAEEGNVMGFSASGIIGTLEALLSGKGMASNGKAENVESIDIIYEMKDGIMRANTVRIKTAGMLARAEGKIDLANWTINHKVSAFADGIALPPILIRGSLNKPAIVPELTSTEAVATGVGALLGGPVGAAIGNVVSGKLGELGVAKQSSPTEPENPGGLPFNILDGDKSKLQQNLRDFLRP
jgi:AsmA protein